MDVLIIHGESGTVKTRVRWEAPCPLSETFPMNGGFGGNVACLVRTEQAQTLLGGVAGGLPYLGGKSKEVTGRKRVKRRTTNAKTSWCPRRQPWKLVLSSM